MAQSQQLHLAGNAYERDSHFPGLYFQASFVVVPPGEVVLRRRQMLAESNAGETFTAFADLDLDALRAQRRRPGIINQLARRRRELFAALGGNRAKGRRPDYRDFATDRLLSIVMALVGEVSVLRQRLDTAERLLEDKGVLSRASIEGYAPGAQAGYERGVETKAYIARVMRGVQQAMAAMADDDQPVDAVIAELREM